MTTTRFNDPEWKKNHPPGREVVTEAEKLMLVACYQRTGNVRKAAKHINLDFRRAFEILEELADDQPEILTDPEPLKIVHMTLKQIAMDLLEIPDKEAEQKFKELSPRVRVNSATYALYHAEKLKEAWLKAKGGAVTGKTQEALQAEIDELDELANRFKRSGPKKQANKAKAAEGGTRAAGTVGVDD